MKDQLPSRHTQMWIMVLLILVMFASFFDRALAGILAENIKRDLNLTDGELGWALGVSFTLFNSILALPIALAADRGYRRTVILASILVWSVMTFLAGFAQNVWQLAITRIGLAIGEAGAIPSSHALVSLKFKPAQTGFLLSMLAIGGFGGMAAAPIIGGWAADTMGWRSAFFILGPVSLLLLPLAFFVLRDPSSVENMNTLGSEREHIERESAFVLLKNPSFLLLLIAISLILAGGSSYLVYSGPFLMRTFGLTATDAGMRMGLAFGIPPVIAALIGGWMYDQLKRKSWRLALGVPAICCALSSVVGIAGWMSNDAFTATVCMAVLIALYGITTAPGVATAQLLAPPDMRSTASAWYSLVPGIIGGSLGPILTGELSDAMQASAGTESLRYGLSAASLVTLVGAGVLVATSFSLQRTMDRRATASSPDALVTA